MAHEPSGTSSRNIHHFGQVRSTLKIHPMAGVLKSESAGGWNHNVVITQKSWTSKKIRVNLDTRPMKEAVKTTHFPIPTPQELRHNFAGSDRYSVVDLNHAFHQFALDEESKELFVFYTPWGLYKYNTLVMGVSSRPGKSFEPFL